MQFPPEIAGLRSLTIYAVHRPRGRNTAFIGCTAASGYITRGHNAQFICFKRPSVVPPGSRFPVVLFILCNEGAAATVSVPRPPYDLVTSINAGEQVYLTWKSSSTEAVKFRVYRSTAPGTEISTSPVLETTWLYAAEKPASDGTYYYIVTALDAAGNESAPSVESIIFYDKAAPVITVSGIEDGKAYSSTVSPVYTVVDSNLNPASPAATLNGAPFNSGTPVMGEAEYTLTVSASDTDNHNASKTLGFAIDKTSPTIAISGVSNGIVYHSPVYIQVVCSDLRLYSTSYLLNSEPYTPGRMIDKDGPYIFTAEAFDKAGNKTLASLNFSLDSPPPAPAKVKVEARSEGGAALSWEKPESDVVGYRVYRDGIRISASLNPSTAFYDAAFSNFAAHTYEVCAIDASGQEGVRASVTIPYISAALQGYGSTVDGIEALNRGFFDTVRLTFNNNGASALALGAVYLDVSASGTIVRSTIAAVNIPGGASAVLLGVMNTYPRWPDSVTLKVSVVLPSAPGTEAVFTRSFVLGVRNPIEPVLELSHQPFVLGVDAAVRLKFNNRGSAPLDIETARVRDNQPVEGGMVSVELRTSGGMLLAQKGLTQTFGVLGAMVDSTLPGDGPVEKELAYYASIPAGSSFLFEPVMLPVPAAVADKLLLSASVMRPAFDLSSTAVTGLGSFQILLEEASVSSAPYSVSVMSEFAVYDQNIPVNLIGQVRAGSGELLAGTSVQVEISGRGYSRVLSGVTDSNGGYSIVFNPMPGEAGIYSLAAFPPEAVNHAIQSAFSIAGFALEPAGYSGTMSQNSNMEFDAALKNTGETPLTGLSWQAETVSGTGVSLSLAGMPSTLEAGTKASLNLKAQAAADASSQAELKLTVTDVNGFSRSFPISLSVIPAMPIPSATPARFETGLLAGESKTQTILLQNKGFNTWADVSVNIAPSLTSWIRVQGSPFIGDIAPGGSASLVLSIAPPADFPSGAYAAANMVEVRSSNADTLAINGAITVTTTRKGSAAFTVVNGDVVIGDPAEFIAGAEVLVKSMDVPELSFTSLTGADGKALFADIPSGNYTYKAGYAGFQEVTGRFTVDPGVTITLEPVLVTDMVTYTWSVSPTTIQDFYEIKLDITLNTSVNAPVVVAEPAFIQLNEPAGKTIYTQYTLTNKGLISAFDVKLTPSDSNSGIKLEVPFTTIPELKPNQSVVVPLKIYIVHTSCEQTTLPYTYDYTCARGIKSGGSGGDVTVANGGPGKDCNTAEGASSITGGGGAQPCVYIPQIAGPDILGSDATTYIISPPPSENKCPSCDPLECDDFVWSSAGDVQIVGGNQGCSITARSPNSEGGSLTVTYANTKQINGCKVTDVTISPIPLQPGATPYATTSVKGPDLKFEAKTIPSECAADLVWTIEPGAGTIAGSGKSATFTPNIKQEEAPRLRTITAKDNRSGKTGTAVVRVEPLSIEITDVITPSESEPVPIDYRWKDSFISLDQIQGIAQISPPAAHDVFKGNIQWEVSETEADGTLIPTGKYGEEAAWKPNPPVKPFSRFPYKLRYRINAKLVFPDLTVGATAYNIMQDMRDGLRQEYTAHDVNVPPVPERKDIVDVGQYVDPGNFSFNEVNSGTYPDLMIFKIAQQLQDVRRDLLLVRQDGEEGLHVNSGYRNPGYNQTLESIGAKHNSNHQFGVAADIAVQDFNNDKKTPYREQVGNKIILHEGVLNAFNEDADWGILADIAEQNEAGYIEPYEITGTWVHMEWD